jgi:hypothetical protein
MPDYLGRVADEGKTGEKHAEAAPGVKTPAT